LIGLFHVELIPAVFAGASMTATSIGITANVFGELGMLRSREGQIVLGAAVLDDILGIVILAVVVALASDGGLSMGPILQLVAAAVLFVLAAIGLSRTAARPFDFLVDRLKAPGEIVVASFLVLCLCCFGKLGFAKRFTSCENQVYRRFLQVSIMFWFVFVSAQFLANEGDMIVVNTVENLYVERA
jgi:hypothetical protein